jgi:hypothetical protein
LTGLGSATFARALDAAQAIYKQFDRQFAEGLLENWMPAESTNSDLESFDMSNRYLTPLKEISGFAESIPFNKGVDPRNILRDMAKNGHIHTEDNYVEYFSMHRDSCGQRRSIKKLSKVNIKNSLLFWIQRFQACEPQLFRVGDIVQVQLSFVVIPVKGGRRRMLTILRSLALLDESFTMNLVSLLKEFSDLTLIHNKGEKATTRTPTALLTLKRKVGYSDTEGTSGREKRNNKNDSKMAVDAPSLD